MDMKYKLLIVATMMIICTMGEIHGHRGYNEEAVPKDYEFTDYLTLNELIDPHNGFGLAQDSVKDLTEPEDIIDEYDEEPFQNMLGDDIDTDTINKDNRDSSDLYEYTDLDIYPFAFINSVPDKKGDIASGYSSLEDDYDGPPKIGMNFKLADVSEPDSDVYVLQGYPDTKEIPRTERNILHVDSDTTVKRSALVDALGPGLLSETYPDNVVIQIPTERYIKSFWNRVFGRQRSRHSVGQTARDKIAPKRNKVFRSRASYFDTLASRLIGK